MVRQIFFRLFLTSRDFAKRKNKVQLRLITNLYNTDKTTACVCDTKSVRLGKLRGVLSQQVFKVYP